MRIRLFFAAALVTAVASLAGTVRAQDAFPAEWLVKKGQAFENATNGSPAYVVRKSLSPKDRPSGSDSPDCWVFHFPVKRLEKGNYIEFDYNLDGKQGCAARYALEYGYGKKWVRIKELDLHITPGHPTTELVSFRLASPVKKELIIRLICLSNGTLPEFKSSSYFSARAVNPGMEIPKDTLRILVVGNSHTFYNFSPSLLKEIAWSQGHYLDLEVSVKGGQTFAQHLQLQRTRDLIMRGGYAAAVLQNNTRPMVAIGTEDRPELVGDGVKLVAMVREYSPQARILLERIWSYPNKDYMGTGSPEAMGEAIEKAARILAGATKAEISPIGVAYDKIRRERTDVSWIRRDKVHPTLPLSYLKACVNYLMLCCPDDPAFHGEVPCCGVEPALAARLREIAVETVRATR